MYCKALMKCDNKCRDIDSNKYAKISIIVILPEVGFCPPSFVVRPICSPHDGYHFSEGMSVQVYIICPDTSFKLEILFDESHINH